MDGGVVPIVPAAVIFDLPVGGWGNRPTADFGYTAAAAASTEFALGTVGGGVGARAGSAERRCRYRLAHVGLRGDRGRPGRAQRRR